MLAFLSLSSQAAELFEGRKAPTFTAGRIIESGDTAGGYPLYLVGGPWYFADAKLYESSGRAESIPLGLIRLSSWDNGHIAAVQALSVNLGANNGVGWSGAPCGGEHLVMRNLAQGRTDNCMTIDPISFAMGSQSRTLLAVVVTETNSGGRYYVLTIGIDSEFLGYSGATTSDWNKFALQADKAKAATIARMTTWAERLQDAATTLMSFNKPMDAFVNLPGIRDLRDANAHTKAPDSPTPLPRPAGKSYTFCESTKKMVQEGTDCPM